MSFSALLVACSGSELGLTGVGLDGVLLLEVAGVSALSPF